MSRGVGGDPFSFVVGSRSPVRMSGGVTGVKVKVDTYLRESLYCPFPNRSVDRAAFRGPSGAPVTSCCGNRTTADLQAATDQR